MSQRSNILNPSAPWKPQNNFPVMQGEGTLGFHSQSDIDLKS